jgi:RNA 2',3'-cyclic 3'-phosphodiesterase
VSARLFVALELPVPVRADLAAFGRAAAARDAALRPVAEEALHVTLAFLGQREPDEVDAVRTAVAGVRAPAPTLALGEVLWLAPRRPHVLTVALSDDGGGLAAVHAHVVAAVAAALPAWVADGRPFRPHVTVARVRQAQRARTRGVPAAPHGAFAGESVALFESHLGGGPARYEVLERVPLQLRARD